MCSMPSPIRTWCCRRARLKAGTASTIDVVSGIRDVLARAVQTLPPALKTSHGTYIHTRPTLSVSNVFDRIYYQTIGLPLGGSWYGEPRGFLLRLDTQY